MTVKSNFTKAVEIIEKAATRAFGLEKKGMFLVFDNAVKECFELNISDSEKLEIKRSSLGWKIRLLCDIRESVDEITLLLSELEYYGYSDLFSESSIITYVAKYFMESSNSQIAAKMLNTLLVKLEADNDANDEMKEYFINYSNGLLDEVEKPRTTVTE